MRQWSLAVATACAVIPGSVLAADLVVDLLPGHQVYRESAGEAGVVMGLSLRASDLAALARSCEQLRAAAGLPPGHGEGLRLEVIFVVPYKGMAVEGYYLPEGDGDGLLLPGNGVARADLDLIVNQAGIPAALLDETAVEHEISCETSGQGWHLRWEDVQPLDGEAAAQVIERAGQRFMTVYQSVVDHNATPHLIWKASGSSAKGG
jgi:hypothetical protein